MITQTNGITFEQDCLIQRANPALFEFLFNRRPGCIDGFGILSVLFIYLIILGSVIGLIALFFTRHNKKWKKRIIIFELSLVALFIALFLLG